MRSAAVHPACEALDCQRRPPQKAAATTSYLRIWELEMRLAEEFAEKQVEVVDAVFALYGITAAIVKSRMQAALD